VVLLKGLTATSVPAQGQAQKAAQRTNDERQFEAIDSYFNGLKLNDVSRIRFVRTSPSQQPLFPDQHRVKQWCENSLKVLLIGFWVSVLIATSLMVTLPVRFEIDWPENVIAHSIDYFTFPTVRSPRLRCIGTRAHIWHYKKDKQTGNK